MRSFVSWFFRQIVPFSPAEQGKGDFINFLAKRGNDSYTHKPSSQKALDNLARMISLFAEHCATTDISTSSSSSSSASSHSSSSSTHRSSSKHQSSKPLPFSKYPWLERVRAAAQRAQAWRNGDHVTGPHHLHCDAVSALAPHNTSHILYYLNTSSIVC